MGNPLSYMGMNLTWEKGRQLKTLKKSGTLSQYVYDNDGRRIQKTVGDKVTRFYLDGDKIIAQKEEGGERMDFLYDEKGTPFAFEYQGKMYFYQTNLQGDIMGIVDSKGSQVVVYRYDAWGEVLMSSDASGFGLSQINPLRYRGYYYDQETGLYYLQTRYYDPKVRRFLNADDASVLTKDPEQLTEKNLYAYCDDNPVMYRDDAGMFVVPPIVIEMAVGAIINVGVSYLAAKATGQSFGIRDLVVAAASGALSPLFKNAVTAMIGSVVLSGSGTAYLAWKSGDNVKNIIVQSGINMFCSLISVNTLIGIKAPEITRVVTDIFGLGSGLVASAVTVTVGQANYKKTSKSTSQSKNISRKKNTKVAPRKRDTRAWKHFLFKMYQLKEK